VSRARPIRAAAAGLALVLAGAGAARAQDPEPQLEEAFLELRYGAVVDAPITALYRDGTFLVPIGALFEQLGIDRELTLRDSVVSGFYVDSDRRYRLDLGVGRLTIGERTGTLAPDEWVIWGPDVYLDPAVYDRLFGLELEADLSRLLLSVRSERELPVAAAARREMERRLARGADELDDAPLRHDLERHAFHPGTVDYLVSAVPIGPFRDVAFAFGAGAEVAGGSLAVRTDGGIREGDVDIRDSEAVWRYVFDPGEREPGTQLTEMSVGRVQSVGLLPYALNAVRLSSAPIRQRRVLGSYMVTGEAEPGWEVELVLDGRIVAWQQVGPDGAYAFEVPLSYGSADVRVQFYGPTGRRDSRELRFQIPYQFLPAGEVDWSVTAGRLARTDRGAFQGDVAVGITERLTTSIGLDHIADSLGSGPVVYDRTSARIGAGTLLTATLAPAALWSLEGETFLPSNASVSARATLYEEHAVQNPLRLDRELEGRGFLPFRFGERTGSLRGMAYERRFDAGRTQRGLDLDALLNVGWLRPSVGWSVRDEQGVIGTRTSELRAGFFAFPPGPLAGTLIRADYVHDLERDQPTDLTLAAGRDLASWGRLEAGVRLDLLSDLHRYELRYILDHPDARSVSSAQVVGGELTVLQSLSGGVVFSPDGFDPDFNRREWVGRAGAEAVLFLDTDADARFDEGEPLVEGGRLVFGQPAPLEAAGAGVIRATDLIPYYRYSARVDLTGVRNPLWVPRYETFSFITEPDRYKRLEIPFYASGQVEGTVSRLVGSVGTGLGGVTVHLTQVDGPGQRTVQTFSDGTFYDMGLMPGRWQAVVDQAQLRALGATVSPEARIFEVAGGLDGDFVEGVDFTVVPEPPLDAEP